MKHALGGLATPPVDEGAGNRAIFALRVVAAMVAVEGWLAIKTKDKKAKALSAALVLIAVIVGWVRFGAGT